MPACGQVSIILFRRLRTQMDQQCDEDTHAMNAAATEKLAWNPGFRDVPAIQAVVASHCPVNDPSRATTLAAIAGYARYRK